MAMLAVFTVIFGLLALFLAIRVARISSPNQQTKKIAKPQSLRSKYGEQPPRGDRENIAEPKGLSGELVGSGTRDPQNRRANFA